MGNGSFGAASERVQKLVREFDELVYELYGLSEDEIKIVEGTIQS
jgi:hypothetical protein